MIRVLAISSLLLSACFNPTFREGLPCASDRRCPGDQFCASDDRCYEPGNGPGSDAGTDAPNSDGGGNLVCSQRILFTSDRDGVQQLYLSDPEVGDVNLTESGLNELGPKWSPDGQRIAFTRRLTASDDEIFVLDLGVNTGTNISMSPSSSDGFAGWHPDQNQILFTSNRDGNSEVYTMNADGSGLRNLSNSPAQDIAIEFSPDGSLVLFRSDRDGDSDLWLMNADGSDKRNVGFFSLDAVWSPTDLSIAYTRAGGVDTDLFILDAVSGVSSAPLTSSGDAVGPAWSPDGLSLAYEDGSFVVPDLFVIEVSDPIPTNLTPGSGGPDRNPRWSPDGQFIAFETQRTGSPEIFSMRIDGSDPERRSLNDEGADEDPQWQPCRVE